MSAVAKYRVVHTTHYTYSDKVTIAHQLAHLRPRNTPWQRLLQHDMQITPEPGNRTTSSDYFGNEAVCFELDTPHDELVVKADSIVEVDSHLPNAEPPSPPWEAALAVPGVWGPGVDLEVEQYRLGSPMAPLLEDALHYARPSFPPQRPWLEAMLDLTQRIHREFTYDAKATTVATKVSEVISKRRGVCQDFAHTMISCLRTMGLPARYVSGYVLNRRTAGRADLVGGDASHAWIAAHCPPLGWVAFDPTNGKIADTEFVTLGWGRDYSDVAPLRGVVLGAATQELAVSVAVRAC